jgi:hypothetical protein
MVNSLFLENSKSATNVGGNPGTGDLTKYNGEGHNSYPHSNPR